MAALTITKITIVQSSGMDKLCFETDLDDSTPFVEGKMSVVGFCPQGHGLMFASTNFPDVPVVINEDPNNTPFGGFSPGL